MNVFAATYWTQLPDGSRIAAIASSFGLDPASLVGHPVVIDGASFLVRDVATQSLNDPSGLAFGLLVVPL